MTINDKIKYENQCDINRETAKILALSSWKIDKYEYLIGEKILPSGQSRIIEEAKFKYFPISKALERQMNATEEKRKKTSWSFKKPKTRKSGAMMNWIPKKIKNIAMKNERYKIRK